MKKIVLLGMFLLLPLRLFAMQKDEEYILHTNEIVYISFIEALLADCKFCVDVKKETIRFKHFQTEETFTCSLDHVDALYKLYTLQETPQTIADFYDRYKTLPSVINLVQMQQIRLKALYNKVARSSCEERTKNLNDIIAALDQQDYEAFERASHKDVAPYYIPLLKVSITIPKKLPKSSLWYSFLGVYMNNEHFDVIFGLDQISFKHFKKNKFFTLSFFNKVDNYPCLHKQEACLDSWVKDPDVLAFKNFVQCIINQNNLKDFYILLSLLKPSQRKMPLMMLLNDCWQQARGFIDSNHGNKGKMLVALKKMPIQQKQFLYGVLLYSEEDYSIYIDRLLQDDEKSLNKNKALCSKNFEYCIECFMKPMSLEVPSLERLLLADESTMI